MEAWGFLQDICGPACALLPGKLVLVTGSLCFFTHVLGSAIAVIFSPS